jgi:hypothetical protein
MRVKGGNMKLTGKVVTIESGDSYTDKLERIVIRFDQADSCYRDVRIANTDGYYLNDIVEVNTVLLPKVARAAS